MIRSEDLNKLAHLARLELNDADRSKLVDQLSSILTYVEQLNELNLDNVEPTSHAVHAANVFREDVALESTQIFRDTLQHAPEAQSDFFRVPRVIKS